MQAISWPKYKRLVFEQASNDHEFKLRFVLVERKKRTIRVNTEILALLPLAHMPAGSLVLE